jgi:hypothetical protein
MHRQSYDLQLTRYDKCGWRDVLYARQVQLPRFARQREQAEPKAPSRPSPS